MSIHQMLGGLTDVLLSIFGMPLALSHQEHLYISDILLGGFKHLDYFPFHIWDIWDNPSHWLIFFRGIETSNQYKWSLKIIYINWWIWSFDRFSKSRLIYKSVAKYHQFDDLKKKRISALMILQAKPRDRWPLLQNLFARGPCGPWFV